MRYVRQFADLGRGDVAEAGGKGANLGELTRRGFPVPPGFVLTTAAYRAFVAAAGIGEQVLALAGSGDAEEASTRIRALFAAAPVPDDVADELRSARAALGPAVAVRSSATAEDLPGASYAGQHDTFLDVRGDGAVLDAVRDCWASLWTARAIQYRRRRGPAQVALAVVVQEMVDADAAGVLFTANPTTGRRDEAVISAAWGLGEAVVGGTVATDDAVVEKATGRVRSRSTAGRAAVARDGGTADRSVPAELDPGPVLDDAALADLVALGVRIEEEFGAPQDVEWARAGGVVAILQARPVTALPEPAVAVPTDWSVPDPTALYARASIVEQLPDPLSPLFAELIDGSVARSVQAVVDELLGRDVLRPGDVGLPTVNGYAYYRYTRAGMLRMLRGFPGALWTLARRGGSGFERRWRERERPRYARAVERWTARPVDALSDAELLDGVVSLLDAGTTYYTAVQTIIPLATSAESAFTAFYDRLVRRAGDEPAATFLLGFDSAPIRAEQSLYDLAVWTRERTELADALRATPPERVVEALADTGATGLAGVDRTVWHGWATRFRAHLAAYGHTVYTLDPLAPVPADDPAPLLGTLLFHLTGGGTDPARRQAAASRRRDDATDRIRARLDPLRRAVFLRLLRRAQATAPLREDALADIGLGWPQLRRMLRELGRRRVADGVLERPDDVVWLRRAELLASPAVPLTGTVAQRKAVWRGQRLAVPPQLLPAGTWWEKAVARWMPATTGEQTGDTIRGVGASGGQVTAVARVIAGPADFARLRPGEVLVASITTPAWTTLFGRVSAVVTDIGGPLSHSSIVAREYGVPAVLGTNVATRRVRDGSRIRVDGDAGTVTLLDE